MTFRLLFVGDVVGSAGCSAVLDLVPRLREQLGLDAVVANAENSAPGGRGITKESGSALLSVADFLTLGNHAFDAEGYEEYLGREERIARPANLDDGFPGRGWGTFEVDGVMVGVANVLGQVFIDRTPISPFKAADEAIARLRVQGADLVLVDAHAEATSEKQALGHHLAGKAHAVLGTHTHVPTADASILSGGTAYVTDVGMTGCEESIIGFDREGFLGLFLGERRCRLSVATQGPVLFSGVLVDFDLDGRRATGIEPVRREWKPYAPPRVNVGAGPFTMMARQRGTRVRGLGVDQQDIREIKVGDIMQADWPTLVPDQTVEDTIKLFAESGISGAPVVEDGRLVGIITEGDLIFRDAEIKSPGFLDILGGLIPLGNWDEYRREAMKSAGVTVGEVMTREVITVTPDDTLSEAATIMAEERIKILPVTEEERLRGVITRMDILTLHVLKPRR